MAAPATNNAAPEEAAPMRPSVDVTSGETRTPVSTKAMAIKGAHTIGAFSALISAVTKSEPPALSAGPDLDILRSTSVAGTTTTFKPIAIIAIPTAPEGPQMPLRTAGPINTPAAKATLMD